MVAHRPGWRRVVGWSYAGALAAMFAFACAAFISQGLFRSPGAALLSGAILLCDAAALAGFCAYIRSTPLFAPIIWRVIVVLLLLRLSTSSSLLASNLFPWDNTTEQHVALMGLLSTLFTIPLLIALWRYAFRSARVWRSEGRPSHA
jgi:hypothetical protein